ncbi:MAG: hypothetical protein AAGF84_06690 [Planctomycetota bacterium]
MTTPIDQLPADRAAAILATIASANSSGPALDQDASLAEALAVHFSGDAAVPPIPTAPTDGTAERLALRLLADDPRYARPVAGLIDGPPPDRFDFGATGSILLLGGLLLALQTRVRLQRDKKGRWTIDIDKQAATNTADLAPLVQKIVALIKGP